MMCIENIYKVLILSISFVDLRVGKWKNKNFKNIFCMCANLQKKTFKTVLQGDQTVENVV